MSYGRHEHLVVPYAHVGTWPGSQMYRSQNPGLDPVWDLSRFSDVQIQGSWVRTVDPLVFLNISRITCGTGTPSSRVRPDIKPA